MMRKFDFEVLGLGMNNKDYPGAFTPVVENIIKETIYGKVLHLYSGSSLIGGERIDIMHDNATTNCTVEDFIAKDNRDWDWILLDPPYALVNTGKLKGYGKTRSLSADVKWRGAILNYFVKHTDNVLWLDYCAPMVNCFARRKLWLLLPGGFHTVRVLSWLQRETNDAFADMLSSRIRRKV